MDTRSVEIAVLLRNTCRSWQTWLFFSANLKGSLTFRLGGGIAMACLWVRDLEKKTVFVQELAGKSRFSHRVVMSYVCPSGCLFAPSGAVIF